MGQLEGKVAIVTGAARGLGRAYALAMAGEGAAILVCDVNSCNETVAAILDAGGLAHGMQVDITSMDSCTAMADQAVTAFGKIDILVNNAGMYGGLKGARFELLDEAQWDAVMNINVKGLWQCCKAVVEPMRAAGGPTLHFTDWRKRNETFFTVLEVERNVMFIILSLIVLVAALNIISGIMMLVKEKSRDIAILRTMGATKGAIMRVFLITGASIGIVGTIAGLVLGVVFCWNIEGIRQVLQNVLGTKLMDPQVYYLTRLPARIDVAETAWIVAMALVLSVLATMYPSWRASRLDPVEALRYE